MSSTSPCVVTVASLLTSGSTAQLAYHLGLAKQNGATEQELIASGRPYLAATRRYGGTAYGWALQDTIPIKIVGGREQGFRGYGVKSKYPPGDWKVQVETTDGREIGRVYFDVEPAPASARTFRVDVQ